MYWQAILIPEAHEGLGLGGVEAIGILERMGMRLYNGPFASTALVTSALLKYGSDQQQATYFERLMAGETATLGMIEQSRTWSADAVTAVATPTEGGFHLSGRYRFVSHGNSADILLLAARIEDELALFLVDGTAEGTVRQKSPTMDQTRPMAEVTLDRAFVPQGCELARGLAAVDALTAIIDVLRIFTAAEQLGGAQASLDMSVDYVKERVQFGRTIASFQAIKHKCADMMLKVEASRSIVYFAACAIDEWLAGRYTDTQLAEAASMAKAYCSDAFFFVAGSGIQLFGGVGITEEYDIQLYFKRAKATESFLGAAPEHKERVADLLLTGVC
jgi:alkylation response protein AidB-like acyl-CoA dehydrogenase